MGLQKLANIHTNTNIQTGIHKYKYKYEYLSHTKPKINMLLYMKAITVGKDNAYM